MAVNKPTEPVPTGWVWVPVNSVARQETGHTPSRSRPEWWGGDIPWIGIRDARLHHGGVIYDTLQTTNPLGLANSSARLLPKGTVCLSRTASVGYVTVMGRDMATSQDFVTWTCSEALVPEFLVKALIAEGEGLRKFGKGTTHTTIYSRRSGRFTFVSHPWPSKSASWPSWIRSPRNPPAPATNSPASKPSSPATSRPS
ncbi:restriction endonuclease subunit S [Sinorhizobium meliloti]|nr:restriction endonuclease subunit S [Sinorhizobium meliloti]